MKRVGDHGEKGNTNSRFTEVVRRYLTRTTEFGSSVGRVVVNVRSIWCTVLRMLLIKQVYFPVSRAHVSMIG